MRLLLAEDDNITRFIMTEMLTEIGWDVEICVNGTEVVRRITQHPFDFALILMDIHMPHMSGVTAAKNIRQSTTTGVDHIPIIALTADPLWYDKERCTAFGFDDFIPKPVTISRLESLLSPHISG